MGGNRISLTFSVVGICLLLLQTTAPGEGQGVRMTPLLRYITSFIPWDLYEFEWMQRLETKIINSLFFKFPFLMKNNKWTSPSVIVRYGAVRGYDTGCFTLWSTKNSECQYQMISSNFNPEEPTVLNVRYIYYDDSKKAETTIYYATSLDTVTFNFANPVRFIIHGMQENETHATVRSIQEALKDKRPTENVFFVAWDGNVIGNDDEETGRLRWYGQAVANTELVGRIVGNFMKELQDKYTGTYADIAQMHCIGLSLGAQICGHVGQWVQRTFGKKLARISALDAADPLFADKLIGNYKTDVKVGPEDAVFVDAIHTSGAKTLLVGAGDYEAHGHVDFYPNGGVTQTGCPDNWLEAALNYFKLSVTGKGGGTEGFSCSHTRAGNLFADSISQDRTTCAFIADKCSSWDSYNVGDCFQDPCDSSSENCVEMGIYATDYPKASGSYYIKTYPEAYLAKTGYCATLFKATAVVSTSHQSTKGRLQITVWSALKESLSEIAYFNDDKEKLEPGSTQYAVVPAYSKDIAIVEIKFFYQKELDYFKFKKEKINPTFDKTITLDSMMLQTRGTTKTTYYACFPKGTTINQAGITQALSATTCP